MPSKQIAILGPGSWDRWRTPKGTTRRAVRWMETYCTLPSGGRAGKTIKIADFQKEWIDEVLDPLATIGVLSVPRGNGKSTFMAAFALWFLFDPVSDSVPDIPIVATRMRQAMRTIWTPAQRMIERNQELLLRSKFHNNLTDPKIIAYNGGEMYPMSDDPDGLQGLAPTLAVLDEIGHQNVESWEALTLAAGKEPTAKIVGCGTVGPNYEIRGAQNALWALHQAHTEQRLAEDVVYHYYSAPDGCDVDDPEAWLAANPAMSAKSPYLDISKAIAAARASSVGYVRMYRLNQWIVGATGWLGDNGAAIWDELAAPGATLTPGAPTWVGIDIGITKDASAVVAVQRWKDDPDRWLVVAQIWTPRKGAKVKVDQVVRYINDLHESYDVKEFAYDRRGFEREAEELEAHGRKMVEYPQSATRMCPASDKMYKAIVAGEIAHDGDRLLKEHVVSSPIQHMPDGGFRVKKDKNSKIRIDACVAMIMAVDRATAKPDEVVEPLVIIR